jgi:putative SOS response-associated peptidase YedK
MLGAGGLVLRVEGSLARSIGAGTLSNILTPYPAAKMIAYPISTRVNNVKNDGPELTEPLEASAP